ncbi:MAG: hypothetical protein ACQEV0_06265 [Bacillota bacterium]
MRDEKIPASLEPGQNQEHKEHRLIRRHAKPLIHFGYFVFVLIILSIVFSLIKVMAE